MKSLAKRVLSLSLILIMTVSMFSYGDVTVKAAQTVYIQYDSRWGNHPYGYLDTAGTQPATIGTSGCGLLALVNAVYYANGRFIQPTWLADYAISVGARPNGGGTNVGILYPTFSQNYGSTYGIQYNGAVYSLSSARTHLQNGGVVVANVPNHFLCIADYDSSTGKYLILDSYPSTNRGTTSSGDWKTASQLTGALAPSAYYLFTSTASDRVDMKTSESGIAFLKDREGYAQYKFWDISQWTIGYGCHCGSSDYPNGITVSQADALLRAQLPTYEGYINTFLNKYNIKINQNQFDALASFTFNFGNVWAQTEDFTLRTYLINGVNNYTSTQITTSFTNWCHADGQFNQGLYDRRVLEAQLFLSDSTPNPDPTYPYDTRYSTPITSYTVSTGNVTTYSSINGSTTGYITGSTDKCTINAIYQNGWVKVTYPVTSGTKTAYAHLSDFINTSTAVTPYSYKPTKNLDVYTRVDMATSYGEVWTNDSCTVVGQTGTKLQLIYPISGGYKMGWVDTTQDSSTTPVAYKTPLKTKIKGTSEVVTYASVSGAVAGEIWSTDECTINTVYSSGWVQVTYPVTGGTKTAYCYLNDFIDPALKVTQYTYYAPKTLTVYERSDLATVYGSIYSTDACTVVAKSGTKLQVIYPVTGGYKMGWIDTTKGYSTPLSSYIAGSSNVTTYTSIGGSVAGAIYPSDACTINAFYSNGWVQVTYPITGGTKTAYCYLNDFIPSATRVDPYSYHPSVNKTTYKKSDMASSYGSVYTTDNCTVVGATSTKLQIIYPVTGGYKLGWIYK